MAKKKAIIDFSSKKIEFTLETVLYKLVSFNQNNMTLSVMVYENGEKRGLEELPFAHAPKETKKLIKPN